MHFILVRLFFSCLKSFFGHGSRILVGEVQNQGSGMKSPVAEPQCYCTLLDPHLNLSERPIMPLDAVVPTLLFVNIEDLWCQLLCGSCMKNESQYYII